MSEYTENPNRYNIDKDGTYFILLHPIDYLPIPGIGIVAIGTSSNTRQKWVECKIVEDRYKVDDNYKVTFESLEPGYGRETFYQSSFISMLKDGFIIKRTSNNQHVEEITWAEPLCGSAYLVHSAYVVTE